MRVIAGKAKGRPLKAVPGKGTRPTTDKVKEAIFSMVGPYFDGGVALDLFAGTGGLGIEALSRGMEQAIFIDMDPKSVEVIKDNLKAAGFAEAAEVYRNEAERAIKALSKRSVCFDLVFLDPPYRLKFADKLMEELAAGGMLKDRAVIVVEFDAGHRYPETFGAFRCRRLATYGETAVAIYDYSQDAPEGEALNETIEP